MRDPTQFFFPMSAAFQNILLLEDTRTVQNYIRDVLRSMETPHQLHTARKVEEAIKITDAQEMDLFIVDIGLPDGNGIDFLVAMSAIHPAARAIIITSTPQEIYRERATALGVLNLLPKPLQRRVLLDTVEKLLRPGSLGAAPETNGFEATIGGLSPADIIQLKCLRQSTSVIEFSHDAGFGLVWLSGGEVIHAECDSESGHQSGLAAFYSIAHWRQGTVRELPEAPACEQTIRRSWQALLMDAEPQEDVA